MVAQSPTHMYMEMLEEGTYALQKFAEVRHPEMAGMAVG